jgi:hypothetical protein
LNALFRRRTINRRILTDDSLWASPWTSAADVAKSVNPRTSFGSRKHGRIFWISHFVRLNFTTAIELMLSSSSHRERL